MGCLKGSMTLQALGGVNSPCGWYRVRGQPPSTGGRDHTHTHTYVPIMYDSLLYWSFNYLRKSSNLLTYLLTCIHTYVTTYVPTYLCTYIPILSTYHKHTYIPKLSTYLLTYIHTYFTTYIPTSLRTFVPTYLYYLHTTIVPTYLNYLRAYLLMYLHAYQPYLSTILAESGLIAWRYMSEKMTDNR